MRRTWHHISLATRRQLRRSDRRTTKEGIIDAVNGLYECLGGLFVLCSVRRLHKDKMVRGLSIWPVLFFTTWGYWNLFFYPSVGAMLSAIGAVATAGVNTVWLLQIIYYSRKRYHDV